ncbi:MAG: hypothetical protein HPY69_08875 [Armatimonadetes bacterium]|nr:hypothetical protein [Armatimonadota bacterium]
METLMVALIIGLTLCLAVGADAAGVTEARVEASNGVPRLLLDGQVTVPFIFFYNTDIGGPEREYLLRGQMEVAMAGRCHIYSLPLRVPRLPGTNDPNFAWPEGLLDRFIAIDPEALFLVRIYPGPDRGWKLWADVSPGELATYADGSTGNMSLASTVYLHHFEADLRAIVRHFESSPYGPRIIAYQPGGPEHEMFGDQYREKGPDVSPANTARFRRWLAARYGSDAALQAAWHQPAVTLATAEIPRPEPGRFPMRGDDRPMQVFYDLPGQRNWVDFSDYSNDLAAECIMDWARAIKEESGRRKLSAFFYGYTMELPGSFSGHYAVQRVLDCPDVDILAGPWSYMDRRGESPTSFMSLVDTIAAHGKLWFSEDDSRTNLLERQYLGEGWETGFNGPITTADLDETLTVIQRNWTAIQTHRAGTWWMDLLAAGAFNHPALGELLKRNVESYAAELAQPTPFRPEVAVIVDERSKEYVRSDWEVHSWTMMLMRHHMGKLGRSVGWYSLADFVTGVVPPCGTYLFANAFVVDDDQREAILQRLRGEQAQAVWVYAPGYLGLEGANARRVGTLTGIAVEESPGAQGSTGEGLLAGLSWGAEAEVRPRLVVRDGQAEVLGRFRDGEVSTARTRAAGYDSIYLGDMLLSQGVLARVCGR